MQNDSFIHETAIVSEDVKIGPGCKIWHFSHIFGASKLGAGCVIGQNVMIGPHVSIGDRCKIQNNVSLYKGVCFHDEVFCGPSVVFTNILTPRAFIDRSDEFSQTTIRHRATIGANATIICGIVIEEYAMVGAGSVVTRNVAAHSLVRGNPARAVGWVSKAGEVLGESMVCPRDGSKYKICDNGLQEIKINKLT